MVSSRSCGAHPLDRVQTQAWRGLPAFATGINKAQKGIVS